MAAFISQLDTSGERFAAALVLVLLVAFFLAIRFTLQCFYEKGKIVECQRWVHTGLKDGQLKVGRYTFNVFQVIDDEEPPINASDLLRNNKAAAAALLAGAYPR